VFTKVLLCHSCESAQSRPFCHILLFSNQVTFYPSIFPVPLVSSFNISQLNFFLHIFHLSAVTFVPLLQSSSLNESVIRLIVQAVEDSFVQFVSVICLLFLSWVRMLSSAHPHTHTCRHVIVTLPPGWNIKV
jgi:hypothetical protein